jgi:hypothetical protein
MIHLLKPHHMQLTTALTIAVRSAQIVPPFDPNT